MPTREKSHKSSSSVDVGVVKAIGHPLRMQLLSRLNERVASPVELARELDESVQLVSYHVRILRDLGFVELVSTTPRRGAIEHHYRAVRRPYFSDEDFASLPANARAAISGTTLEGLMQHAAAAHRAGAFEQKGNVHISSTDLLLDDEALGELAGMMTEVLDRALALQTESRARLQNGASEARAHVSLLLYPSDGTPPETGRGGRHSPKRGRKKS